MKPASSRLRSLVFSILAVALLPLAAMAETSTSIFSAKAGLAEGWKATAWSGPAINEVNASVKGTTMLQVDLLGECQPYAGIALATDLGSGIKLTEKLRKTGKVIITLTPGKNIQGETSTVPQPLQLAISFLTKDGQTVHASFDTQAFVTATEAVTKISISLPGALLGIKAPERLDSLSAVRVQFIETPVSGFNITDCSVKTE